MTSSVNAVKWKSDGIYGIFGVTVLRLLPELNRRAMGTRCIVCILFAIPFFLDPPSCFLAKEDIFLQLVSSPIGKPYFICSC